MKKVIAVLCVLLVVFLLYTDYKEKTELAAARQEAAYKEAWNEGYDEGYADGHDAATQETPRTAAYLLSGELDRIASDIRSEYGMDTVDAFGIIMNYLDGEPTENRDLNTALWIAWEYNRAVHKAIDDIGR